MLSIILREYSALARISRVLIKGDFMKSGTVDFKEGLR
jgi:hypothetical protein